MPNYQNVEWSSFDAGNEQCWKQPLWQRTLEIIAQHEGEDRNNANAPIYAALNEAMPEVAWIGKNNRVHSGSIKHHKYHARRTTVLGCTFPSRAEAARWVQLQAALDAGAIRDLERQVQYRLEDCSYFADFRYFRSIEGGAFIRVVEDVKGRDTPMSRLKRRGVKRKYGVTVEIVKMNTKTVDLLLAAAGTA